MAEPTWTVWKMAPMTERERAAFAKGAEAMREAAVQKIDHWHDWPMLGWKVKAELRALPLPEYKP